MTRTEHGVVSKIEGWHLQTGPREFWFCITPYGNIVAASPFWPRPLAWRSGFSLSFEGKTIFLRAYKFVMVIFTGERFLLWADRSFGKLLLETIKTQEVNDDVASIRKFRSETDGSTTTER